MTIIAFPKRTFIRWKTIGSDMTNGYYGYYDTFAISQGSHIIREALDSIWHFRMITDVTKI